MERESVWDTEREEHLSKMKKDKVCLYVCVGERERERNRARKNACVCVCERDGVTEI